MEQPPLARCVELGVSYLRGGVPLLCLFLFGCSLLVSTDFDLQECASSEDCQAPGAETSRCVDGRCVGSPFACLDGNNNIDEDPPERTVTLNLVLAETDAPPTNTSSISIRLCSLFDLPCTLPRTSNIPVTRTGRLVVALEDGFNGFLEVNAPETLPTLVLLVERSSFEMEVVMFTEELLGQVGQLAGSDLDFGLAQGFAWTLGCDGQPAGGVRIASPSVGVESLVYLPDVAGTETTSQGNVVLLNVPPSFSPVEGIVSSTDNQLGVKNVPFRPGWISYFAIEVQ